MTRLSDATLALLPPDVARPAYDRRALETGVVHFGIGAFHRGHQAVLFDDAAAAGDLRWGVLGVSLRSPMVRDRLRPQDGLYTLVSRGPEGERARIIGVVRDVLVAPENPTAVITALAAPGTHLVTLTITEKAYHLTGGTLDAGDPDVAHDLASLEAPRTATGFLVAGLAARHVAGLAPFTILSCDNLPGNGRLLREAVLTMAHAHDPALADWIAAEGAFPQSMVDRIVPATTERDIAALAERLGVEDRAPVLTEPFFQWVIEDDFRGPRPDFAGLGAQLVADVAPWEEAKLRLLNGAHSGIAYLGGLAGIDFVHEFVADPARRRFVEMLWDESAATLAPTPGLDRDRYRADLMARFANPALQHRTRQIAMDGSQKLPQRLLAPIAARRAKGQPVEALALAVAAWMRWQSGIDDCGEVHVVDDPLAATTAAALAGKTEAAAQVDALLAIAAIFPPALSGDAEFRAVLTRHLEALHRDGASVVVKEFVR